MEEKNFEELRNQFAILKEQLNKQEIVNDRLLRETMKAKKKDINSTKNLEYGCVLFCLFILPLNWYTRTARPHTKQHITYDSLCCCHPLYPQACR